MPYLWFKSFHIIGFVAWFAGLFYLPRLFVYHIEAAERPEAVRTVLQSEFSVLEQRLYKLIMNPAMIFTLVMAAGIIWTEPEVMKQPWLHAKLAIVLLLIGFHHYCGRIIKKLAAGTCTISSIQMRRLNEVPTILLALAVLLAIFKGNFPTSITAWGTIAAVIAFAVIIQLYARKRRLAQAAQGEEVPANELGTSG
jgi:protoporphyrinogen IX oxidase